MSIFCFMVPLLHCQYCCVTALRTHSVCFNYLTLLLSWNSVRGWLVQFALCPPSLRYFTLQVSIVARPLFNKIQLEEISCSSYLGDKGCIIENRMLIQVLEILKMWALGQISRQSFQNELHVKVTNYQCHKQEVRKQDFSL